MNSYQKYKNSEVEWIGEIPEHWHTKRLKYLGNLYGGLTGKKGEDFVENNEKDEVKPYISFSNIGNNNFMTNKDIDKYVKISISEKQNRVSRNDLLFLMSSENYEDLGRSSLYIDDNEELYLNSFCKGLHITDKNFDPNYLEWLLLGDLHRKHLQIYGNGFTRINLRQDDLKNIPITRPPLPEQTTIASYLDHKTSLIDKLIKKNEKLIKLLEEKRKATINQAVTKGLNPKVKVKDSGVEWIGEIPEHWDRTKFKNIVSEKISDGPHETPEFFPMGIPFLSAESIDETGLNFAKKRGYITKEQNEEYKKKSNPQKGDILFCKSGSTTGKSAMVETNKVFGIWSPLAIIRVNEKMSNMFTYYYMQSIQYRTQVVTNWTFGTQPNIGMGTLENLWIPIPELVEQIRIANYLHEVNELFGKIVNKVKNQNTLLKEYRQSLISNVVTGKIDVRDYKLSKETDG